MDFIKNIYKSIDTEKNFMYRKKMTTSKMNNCTFYYFSFQGYYFYPDYFCCNESSPKLMSL
jgi:hypothetical protein